MKNIVILVQCFFLINDDFQSISCCQLIKSHDNRSGTALFVHDCLMVTVFILISTHGLIGSQLVEPEKNA